MAIDLAYCGLDCAACDAYHAVERLTLAERAAVAEKWNKEYGGSHTAEDIDCVGCTTREGHHAPHCGMCEIRSCAEEKAVATCAGCGEYACEKLAGFLAMVPEAKATLEALRAG